jgi:hypothetical protein
MVQVMKKAPKKTQWVRVTVSEIKLMNTWHKEGVPTKTIASRLSRPKKTIYAHMGNKDKNKVRQGRPPIIDADKKKRLKVALTRLLKQAKAKKEVTLDMVAKAARVKCTNHTVRKSFKEDGVKFRKLREKPILTKKDVLQRRTFTSAHKKKSPQQWVRKPHGQIDNKNFPLYLDAKGRDHEARRSVRGAYSDGKDAVADYLVKPKGGNCKFSAKSVQVTAGVIKGKIRMWEYVEGRWNGQRAAEMYAGPLRKALTKAFPGIASNPRKKFQVLEDNDPAGYKCRKGLQAKEKAGITTLDLPPRSPDFNVLDYSLWVEINKRMRQKQAKFAESKKETKQEYMNRLRRTALALPTSVVKKAVGDMTRRVALVAKAKGKLIEG